MGYETEASIGESVPEAVEDGGPTGVGRGGHGSEVCPGGLFHQSVSDRNLVTRMGGEGGDFGRLDDGGCGWEDVAEGGVGSWFER